MARASITCTCYQCGKEFRHVKHNLYSRQDANDYETWAAANIDLCPDCYRQQQRAAEAAKVKDIVGDLNLTELTGSPKQIAWAARIRAEFVAEWCPEITDDKAEFIQIINKYPSAAWWIDNRRDLLERMRADY